MTLDDRQREMACLMARASIRGGLGLDLTDGKTLSEMMALCDSERVYGCFRELGASFTTLEKNGALRGCIGSLVASRSLCEDICENSLAAANRDPRFPALMLEELSLTTVSLSVLSRPQPLIVTSEKELFSTLRPGVDGLILSYGTHRSTYLPSVWQQLPEPDCFVRELKKKAGLDGEFWDNDMEFKHYQTDYFTCQHTLNH